jgi:hypothetical protein
VPDCQLPKYKRKQCLCLVLGAALPLFSIKKTQAEHVSITAVRSFSELLYSPAYPFYLCPRRDTRYEIHGTTGCACHALQMPLARAAPPHQPLRSASLFFSIKKIQSEHVIAVRSFSELLQRAKSSFSCTATSLNACFIPSFFRPSEQAQS